ncbi:MULTISPECIES: VC0807 family protein [unclassified Streptomyces]|uniref:VC0807 family protein n=1 Tax=unclassified Streptomyces TaxID=2593676 RepID=UPI000B29597C|nr:VC0807 family protein [Streptomyces sp. Root264]
MTPPTPSEQPTTAPADGESATPQAEASSAGRGLAVTIAFDVVIPTSLYYVLRGAGLSEIPSLLLSGAAPAVHTLHSAVRHRKLDAIGVFVIALLIGGTAASLITANPRVVLARSGLVTACAGIWLLVTLATAQPFTFRALKSLLPGRTALLDRLWETDPGFRRVWHGMTWLWGLGLMADALVRVFMAFALPVDAVPALDGVLYAATWLVLQVITQITLFRTGTLAKIFPHGGRAAPTGVAGPENS